MVMSFSVQLDSDSTPAVSLRVYTSDVGSTTVGTTNESVWDTPGVGLACTLTG